MSRIENAKRIVIKVGSALLVDQETGLFKEKWMRSLVEDIKNLTKSGKEVVVVTSGSVALGRRYLNVTRKNLKLEEKQAVAAAGQVELMLGYRKQLEKVGLKSAQILVTIRDAENRRRYLNARNTMETLIAAKVIPIINENDTVATNELRFGDNDRLGAIVAQMVSADILVLLSDIDGLYTANPKLETDAVHIDEVKAITKEIENMAGGSLSFVGSGGMITKVAAAKIATSSGCHMVIAEGTVNNPIQKLLEGKSCTWFLSEETPLNSRKKWIANRLVVRGEIVIDGGAVIALKKGSSLLPAGVIDVKGRFTRGDAVAIVDHNLQEVGRGLSAYNSGDARLIVGQHSSDIKNIVGFAGREELIHRDDMVMFSKNTVEKDSDKDDN